MILILLITISYNHIDDTNYSGPEIHDSHIDPPPANRLLLNNIPPTAVAALRFRGGRQGSVRPRPSDSAIVRVLPAGLGQRLHHEEGDGAKESNNHQDEQLPVQQQVVAVGERHCRHDGLWKEKQEC